MLSEDHVKLFSHSMRCETEILVFGHSGAPVLVFPDSSGRFDEWKEFLMIDTLADKIEAGFIQLYCIDSFCSKSWYNQQIHPSLRLERHNAWESYVASELVPLVRSRNSNPFIITAGVNFGAYLAVNFAFKHSDIVRKTVGLGGSYSINRLLNGYSGEDTYFNSPMAYMSNMGDPLLLSQIRSMEIFLITSDLATGVYRHDTYEMSRVLNDRGIPHTLDDWGGETIHDWPSWRIMVRNYL